jgi:hypothetical protein
MPEVWVPPRMLKFTRGQQRVRVTGATIHQVVMSLERDYPGAMALLCEGGEIVPWIAVIVDGEDTNLGILEPVRENSEIHFLPSIAGGSLP